MFKILISESLYNQVIASDGENLLHPLKMTNQTISTLRDFSQSLAKLYDYKVYYYAVNGKRMEKCIAIRNRLIK